jgi:copper chaperone
MKTYKFKTNIKCGGCVDTISSYLDNAQEISQWDVDTLNNDNILTVSGPESLVARDVIDIVNLAGFTAKPVKKGILTKIFGT